MRASERSIDQVESLQLQRQRHLENIFKERPKRLLTFETFETLPNQQKDKDIAMTMTITMTMTYDHDH